PADHRQPSVPDRLARAARGDAAAPRPARFHLPRGSAAGQRAPRRRSGYRPQRRDLDCGNQVQPRRLPGRHQMAALQGILRPLLLRQAAGTRPGHLPCCRGPGSRRRPRCGDPQDGAGNAAGGSAAQGPDPEARPTWRRPRAHADGPAGPAVVNQPDAAHRRRAIRLVFLIHALATGSMFTRIPDLQQGLGIDAGVLGLTFIGQPVGAILMFLFSSRLVERLGTRPILLLALPLMAIGVLLMALAPSAPALFLAIASFSALFAISNVA